jgi:TATA-box binding protein (TBP) (component of TFIID and TFIIIB)
MHAPTPYRISTITVTGSVGTCISLDALYDCLSADADAERGITYVEYGVKKSQTVFKGLNKKQDKNKRKNTPAPSKRFDNQVTVVYRTSELNCLNVKIFKNGNVQATGIKSIDRADEVLHIVADILRRSPEVVEDPDALAVGKFKIQLINTDYRIGFPIKRDVLHRLLKKKYGLFCNFEPVIYPGVKVNYFYNAQRQERERDGVCRCEPRCHERKRTETMVCKKITIAVFQSGCIIITGSQSKEQIDECYAYINRILYANHDLVRKHEVETPEAQPTTLSADRAQTEAGATVVYRIPRSSIVLGGW